MMVAVAGNAGRDGTQEGEDPDAVDAPEAAAGGAAPAEGAGSTKAQGGGASQGGGEAAQEGGGEGAACHHLRTV